MSNVDDQFLAKKLRHTELSLHIENRVNRYLQEKNVDRDTVVVRVLSDNEKNVLVMPRMKQQFCLSEKYPSAFPYRSKAIFAFEVIDEKEICLFGLFVQEYGSSCPAPNSRSVYIAYLDSVNFFQPKQFRTDVYHQILLGYLEYANHLGYTMAYIWSVPPSEDAEYIFHCHPKGQKVPTKERLRNWYTTMLDQAVAEGIVVEYQEFFAYANATGMRSITEMPYFEGDKWPPLLEYVIANGGNRCNDIVKESKETMQYLWTREMSNGKSAPSWFDEWTPPVSKAEQLWHCMVTLMGNHSTDYIVITLSSVKATDSLPVIEDPDPLIYGGPVKNVFNFMSIQKQRSWQFENMHSAMMSTRELCVELHNNLQFILPEKPGCSSVNDGARFVGSANYRRRPSKKVCPSDDTGPIIGPRFKSSKTGDGLPPPSTLISSTETNAPLRTRKRSTKFVQRDRLTSRFHDFIYEDYCRPAKPLAMNIHRNNILNRHANRSGAPGKTTFRESHLDCDSHVVSVKDATWPHKRRGSQLSTETKKTSFLPHSNLQNLRPAVVGQRKKGGKP